MACLEQNEYQIKNIHGLVLIWRDWLSTITLPTKLKFQSKLNWNPVKQQSKKQKEIAINNWVNPSKNISNFVVNPSKKIHWASLRVTWSLVKKFNKNLIAKNLTKMN